MREKGSVEREGVEKSHHRGYIHNVDKSSISFFVTNLPDECNMGDLWKVFGKYGRLGDVYIPNKVDKRGKRFAFVKFRVERDSEELEGRMEDVWLGTYNLRINRSRFERRDHERKQEEAPVSQKPEKKGEGSSDANRTFKHALLDAPARQVENELQLEGRNVLNVEVDRNVLKDLQMSFVGRLAVNVEVHQIRTNLFMEGLAHIEVTHMGRDMVLIHSPKVGEVERLWRNKADWITYYFRKVFPWSPACFVDKRDTWVKVYGIPLHVWGENLFKAIGDKYGEFLDFDNSTASRAKLDVACLKIATDFRGKIDDSVLIKAMGVRYTLRVVEDQIVENGFFCGERLEERESSWVESVNCPVVERVIDGGSNGGVEEEVFPVGCNQLHGASNLHDGDGTVAIEGKKQNQPFVSGETLEDQDGKLVPYVCVGETFLVDNLETSRSQGKRWRLEIGEWRQRVKKSE
jgi:hypothetical protein